MVHNIRSLAGRLGMQRTGLAGAQEQAAGAQGRSGGLAGTARLQAGCAHCRTRVELIEAVQGLIHSLCTQDACTILPYRESIPSAPHAQA